MMVVLDREQRDAVRETLLTDLAGVGDIGVALANGDWAAAQRFRRLFEDDMRLLDDLGWGEDDQRERYEITMPPVSLARVAGRLHELFSTALQRHVSRPLEDEQRAQTIAIACVAYGAVLTKLADPASDRDRA